MRKQLYYVLVFLFSLTALGFSLVRITPFSINGDTYIGIIATFIGISVTLLIGHQISNTLETKRVLSEVKEANEKLISTQKRISQIEYEMEGSLRVLYAKINSKEQEKCAIAFLYHQDALNWYLKKDREEFDEHLYDLEEYIKGIQKVYIKVEDIDEYLNEAYKISEQIKSQINYAQIKHRYEHIMKCFVTRLDNCRDFNTAQISEEERMNIVKFRT